MSMSDKPSKQADNENDTFSELAKRFLWADSPDAVQRLIKGLGILCAVLFVLDFIIHRHAYAPGEGTPGFYAVVGFGAFTVIVLGATQLRRLILRNENYYSPYSVDAEAYPEEGLEKLAHGEDDAENKVGESADVARGRTSKSGESS